MSLRDGITYGEREWCRRALTIFVKKAVSDEPLVVFRDGSQVRDFIYVGDLVCLHNLSIESAAANGRVYNAGTGVPTMIADLARTVIAVSGKELRLILKIRRKGSSLRDLVTSRVAEKILTGLDKGKRLEKRRR